MAFVLHPFTRFKSAGLRVPKDKLLGSLDLVLPAIHGAGSDEWMLCGLLGLGMAEAAYEHALSYTRQRIQNGVSSYGQHQVIRHDLAKMWGEVEALRALCYIVIMGD